MYSLNKVIGYLISPVGFGMALVVAAVLARVFGRRRLAGWAVLLALANFWVWSTPWMTQWMGTALEAEFLVNGRVPMAESFPQADALVLHGGSMGVATNIGPYAEMWTGADRVWHAARLWKAGKAPKILVTSAGTDLSTGPLLEDLGVPKDAIIYDFGPRNTEEEAKAIARMFECSECSNARPKLVRMTHANLDPVRLRYHGWKKRLVAPIERWLFRRTDRVVVTCEAEKKWCQEWGLRNEFEIVDLKQFFDLDGAGDQTKAPPRGTLMEYTPLAPAMQLAYARGICVSPRSDFRSVRLLYLGRRHPLKGVEYLELAVEELNQSFEHSEQSNIRTFELRIVSDHFGEELEKDWDWCDVLVLPTLSENFGLVVAEALERGKRVITTDGAPVWGEGKMFGMFGCSNGLWRTVGLPERISGWDG